MVWHSIVVWVSKKDGTPCCTWSMFDNEDDATIDAAMAIKGKPPTGFFIGFHDLGGDAQIVDAYLPFGGPKDFNLESKNDGHFELSYKGIPIL